jgi:hypothetical protein
VFALLNAAVFERCFISWMRSICGAFDGLQVALARLRRFGRKSAVTC